MANEYEGNAIPVPGLTTGPSNSPDELLASAVGYTQRGVTIAGGQGVLATGTVLGRVTATKKWMKYDNGDSPAGIGVARGILRQAVDTTDGDVMGNVVIRGILKNSKVSGADANALTDLGARQDTVLDTFTF